MKKTFNFALLAALSTTALAGCTGLLDNVDLTAQAEEIMAFEVDLDAYVPTQLSEAAYTDETTDGHMSVNFNGNDRYVESNGVGVQMQAYHSAYDAVKAAFNGIERFQENRGELIEGMRRNNMFGRGNRFRNVVNNIDYEVVVEDGVTTLLVQFDLGTYEVQQTTDEVTGDVLTWGSFTNPYGASISFLTTNDDLLQVSVDRSGDARDTYLSFLREGDVITANLVNYVADETSFEVLGAGQAIFESDYSYVGYNTINETGIVRDYVEMEVYSTLDSTLLATRRSFTLLQTDYDLLVLPIVTLGDFTQDDIFRNARGRISIDGTAFPTKTELLTGDSEYAVFAEGRIRYTGNTQGMPYRSIESITLQMNYDAFVADGLPTPFVSSVVEFDTVLANLESALVDYQAWFAGLTIDDVTFDLPEIVVEQEPVDDELISSSSEEPAISSSSSEPEVVTSGTGV